MASGDSLAVFNAANQVEPVTTNPADQVRTNQRPALAFDATTDEEAVFSSVMPEHYDGGGITVVCKGWMASATSGNLVLQADIENVDGQAVGSDSFAGLNTSGQVAVPGTADTEFDATITFTDGADMDSVGVGDNYRIKIRRDADNTSATDDAAGDYELDKVYIKET